MRFRSLKERMQHPQARLIPESIWKSFFHSELPNLLIPVMQKKESFLIQLRAQRTAFKEIREATWLAIALSHPELSIEEFREINTLLEISEECFFQLSVILGNQIVFEAAARNLEANHRLHATITANKYNIFHLAAINGHLRILQYLETKVTPQQFHVMITTLSYETLRFAVENGHVPVLRYFESKMTTEHFQKLITEKRFYMFRSAAAYGQLEVLQYLETRVTPDQLQTFIATYDHEAFRLAAAHGHRRILHYIETKATPDQLQTFIAAYDYEAFRFAAANGHVDVLQYLEAKVTAECLQKMIATYMHDSFRFAAANGHLTILQYLEQKVTAERLQAMIEESNYYAYRFAATNGHLPVVRYLEQKVVPRHLQTMLSTHEFDAFRWAVKKERSDVIAYLLQHHSILEYAEANREFNSHIIPFIDSKLEDLRARKMRFMESHGTGVFNVADKEARVLFYVLRGLIRRNYSKETLFSLLEIPAVNALAAKKVTPGRTNELIRLAAELDNHIACELLLAIPEVCVLAETYDYYINTCSETIHLKTMAQDQESSMQMLSERERQHLTNLHSRYQSELRTARGADEKLNTLRNLLATRYRQNPATITRRSESGEKVHFELPFSWEAFQALSLSQRERKAAYEAYYQHRDHTAWRYLAQPNPWMYRHARFVGTNPERPTEHWSTYEAYSELISLLFLAAKDERIPEENGYTVNARISQFINELAHLGRGHNWAGFRKQTDEKGQRVSVRYDDLQGDKPIAYAGITDRWFRFAQRCLSRSQLMKPRVNVAAHSTDETSSTLTAKIEELSSPRTELSGVIAAPLITQVGLFALSRSGQKHLLDEDNRTPHKKFKLR